MADQARGPLADYAHQLDTIEPSDLATLDQWVQGALAVGSPIAATTGLSLARGLWLIVGLAVPAAIVGPALVARAPAEHRAAPILDDDDGDPSPRPTRVDIPLLDEVGPAEAEAAIGAPPEAEPPVALAVAAADRGPRRRDLVAVPAAPELEAQPELASSDRTRIDRARDLAKQSGRWSEARREYAGLIEEGTNLELVETAYRELITKLFRHGERDEARRYIEAYLERFPDSPRASSLEALLTPANRPSIER